MDRVLSLGIKRAIKYKDFIDAKKLNDARYLQLFSMYCSVGTSNEKKTLAEDLEDSFILNSVLIKIIQENKSQEEK